MTTEPTVVHEDPHLLALNKPAPLLTQAPPGIESAEARAKDYLRSKYAKPGGVYLGVPHRLDRPVTGVLLFCRNTKCAQRVQAQFEARTVVKEYVALLDRAPSEEAGVWVDWLLKVEGEARTVVAAEGVPGAKRAELAYRVEAVLADGRARVRLLPKTGRSHQLRVQTSSRGCPIAGDAVYGSTGAFGPDPGGDERARVIALHAEVLKLVHPFGGGELVIRAEFPETWPADARRA